MGFLSSIGNIFSGISKVAAPVSAFMGQPWVGAALAGAGEMWSAASTNRANKSIAARQMSFQEEMSGTAYQRAVEDMKKAGLNPGLMYGSGSAASTPAGASIPSVDPKYGAAVSNALGAMRVKAEIENIKAQTALTVNSARSAAVNAAVDETIGSGLKSVMKVGGAAVNSARSAAGAYSAIRGSMGKGMTRFRK